MAKTSLTFAAFHGKASPRYSYEEEDEEEGVEDK